MLFLLNSKIGIYIALVYWLILIFCKTMLIMKNLTTLTGIMVLFCSQLSMANTLILPSFSEPDLMGILDDEFGLDSLLRIDDDMDLYWTVTGEISATVIAKHAGYSQNSGFLNSNNNFSSLLYVPYMDAQSASSDEAETGSQIRFGLTRGAKPSSGNKPIFSSNQSDNVLCHRSSCSPELDHMVSWLITDGEYVGDYVLAWEDLMFLGDQDYNDLVIRVSGVSQIGMSQSAVPVPAAVWLFGSGLTVLGIFARRRNRI